MLILYKSIFSKNYIINIIKLFNIKKYSKLSKIKLIELLNYTKASIYIQQYVRKLYNDDLNCPITLTRLQYPFVSIKNSNTFRYYTLTAFVEYLNKSNDDFRDPFTRELLNDSSLKQIEYLISYYKINNIFNKKTWRKKINSRAEYLTITNCLNEILNDIFSVSELHFNFIYNEILPQFIYYFHFLLKNHKSNCYSVINNYINCINHHSCPNKIFLIDYLKLVIIINNL